MCDLRKENDDLKGTVETLEDVKRDAGSRRDNLQKENDVLEQHITELQEEVRWILEKLEKYDTFQSLPFRVYVLLDSQAFTDVHFVRLTKWM